MPLRQYFLVVGGVLLALLFIADTYLPKLPVAPTTTTESPVVIRIHSDRKSLERIVFDTSLPTIAPPAVAIAEDSSRGAAAVADASPRAPVLEAFAQMQPSDAVQLKPAGAKKQEPRPQHRRKAARRHGAPPMMLVAKQPHVGWFGNGIW